MLYLSNYAHLQVRDELTRLPGVGSAQVFGAGEYSMRVWLDPDRLASRQLTASDVVRAIREQNVQVAAGVLGAPPAPSDATFQLSINTQGRLTTESEFASIVVRATDDGQITRLSDVARLELGSSRYSLRSLLDNKPAVAIGVFQRPGTNALQASQDVRDTMERLKADLPAGCRLPHRLRPDGVRQRVDRRGRAHAVRGDPARRHRRDRVPADVAGLDHSPRRRAGVADWHFRGDARSRLLAQHPVALRPRARHRHRRGRCHRRGGERRTAHRAGAAADGSDEAGDGGSLGTDRRDCARARRGVRANGVRQRPHRAVLPAVRA